MGLFGALFAGVSGLDSQSNKIGIISNNISNVNTVGYKQSQSTFDTLVVPSGTTSFSPGGTIGGNQQLVNQQGTISASTSATDIAISGNGFVVVSQTPAGVGTGDTPYYTRSGSFTQDSQGNFVNSNGYYLQGLPIEANGEPEQANTQNMTTVKISQSATGSPTATSTVALQANLDATQAVFPGASVEASLGQSNGTSAANAGISASQIILSNDVPGTLSGTSDLVRGNSFTITSTQQNGTQVNDTYTYGGFMIGRSASSSSNNNANAIPATPVANGDGQQVLNTGTVAAGNITNDSTGGANGTVTVTVANALDYVTATQHAGGLGTGFMSVSGITSSINGIPSTDLNGEFAVTYVDATHVSFTAADGATGTNGLSASSTQAATVSNRTATFTGNILNATSTTSDFITNGTSGLTSSDFTPEALTFSVSVGGNTPVTLKYSSSADPSSGTFNNMQTLAQAISDQPGMTATISQDGRLYVSATDPNQALTFTNGDAVGNSTSNPPQAGINWTQELGLPTQSPALPVTTPPTHYFNSLQSLANDINGTATDGGDPLNLTAVVSNPNAASTLSITEANPEQTVAFTDNQATGSVLKELGIADITQTGTSPITSVTGVYTTGTLGITYNASSSTTDMSSGKVPAQFSKDITVYDSQGFSHTLALNYLKIGTNTWAMEVTAVPASDVTNTTSSTVDGQIASGTITFNGQGGLGPVTGTISSPFAIDWSNGASPSNISLDLGELQAAATDGSAVSQTAGPSTVSQATQNGAPTGELTGVTIDQNGFVIAAFSNGQTQKLYQVPLAVVNNPDGLEAVSGDAYQQTLASGDPTLDFANEGGAGQFTPSALEQSNVDLSTQLTDLIVAQQAYGANSKLLTVADTLLQELDQIIQ